MRKTVLLATAAVLLAVPFTATASDTLAAARAAYDARADQAEAKRAVELFARAAQEDPKSYAARWEYARAAYFYGTYTREEASDTEKMAIFQAGIDRAREAIALDDRGVEGHFWLGVLYGVYGEAKGIFKSLALVPDIRREMEASIAVDPAVEGWGPDRVLGRMLYKLPGFKGGDNQKSIEHLERSVKGAPTNALTRLYLAETYKSEGRKADAIAQLEEVVRMTPDPRWTAEHPYITRQAEKLLKKLR